MNQKQQQPNTQQQNTQTKHNNTAQPHISILIIMKILCIHKHIQQNKANQNTTHKHKQHTKQPNTTITKHKHKRQTTSNTQFQSEGRTHTHPNKTNDYNIYVYESIPITTHIQTQQTDNTHTNNQI